VELAGTAAVSGVSRAQEARQAQQTLKQFEQRLDAANRAAQQHRDAAEKDAGL
jgi:F0F1-type ATP synthase membrane subunit b/b'